jgi:hypothetical protein
MGFRTPYGSAGQLSLSDRCRPAAEVTLPACFLFSDKTNLADFDSQHIGVAREEIKSRLHKRVQHKSNRFSQQSENSVHALHGPLRQAKRARVGTAMQQRRTQEDGENEERGIQDEGRR